MKYTLLLASFLLAFAAFAAKADITPEQVEQAKRQAAMAEAKAAQAKAEFELRYYGYLNAMLGGKGQAEAQLALKNLCSRIPCTMK